MADSNFSLPTYGIGNNPSMDEVIAKFYHKLLIELQVMIPAAIVSYDRATHIAIVQPLNNRVDIQGRELQRAQMKVTVMRHYAGKYLIDFPLEVGDTGWVIACDRDSSAIKQYNPDVNGVMKGVNIPITGELHQYYFGYFIPDRWGDKYNTDSEHNAQLSKGEIDEKRLVIQSADGSQRISIGQCDIKVYSTNTTINTTSDCIINADAAVTVNAGAEVSVTSGADVSVNAENVRVTAKAVNLETDSLEVSGGIASKASASGTLSAGSVAQVKDGLIVSITNA